MSNKSAMTESIPIASVISTGGGGGVFEQHVGASFLGLLLVGGFLPVFPQAVPAKLHFQAKRLGWNVDDLVIDGVDPLGQIHHLAAQIKRTFAVSESDDDCRATFLAAWRDFHNSTLFDRSRDALLLIVHLGTNRLLGDFGWLLTQARASLSVEDFALRRTGSGLLNKRSKADYESVKKILAKETGETIDETQLWQFLCAFHLLSYDLSGQSAKDEAWVRTLLELVATDGVPQTSAEKTWSQLVELAGKASTAGQSLERDKLPSEMLLRHRPIAAAEHSSVTALRQHSDTVLKRVADGANGLTFPRVVLAGQLADAASASRLVLIVGSAGSGKSVLAKRLVKAVTAQYFAFAFAAEEFRAPHIDKVLSDAQIGVNWSTLRSLLAMQDQKMVLIEGLERLLESDDRGALLDLLRAVADDHTLNLVITCRDYHAETVERTMLRPSGVEYRRVVVPDLSEDELTEAIRALPVLQVPLSSPSLRRLLRNPFMLARAAELSWPVGQALPLTEKALRERLWSEVVCRDHQPRDALPRRRAAALTKIALDRARSLQPYVEQAGGDAQAIDALASDNLIVFDSPRRVRIAPAHDVFEDWALVEWLSSEFASAEGDANYFALARESHPALRRAYRKWLQEMIESDPSAASAYLSPVTSNPAIPDYFRDDTLVAVFQSSAGTTFLSAFSSMLLQDDARLLCRAIHLVRVACKTVSPLATKGAELARQWHVPAGAAWPTLLAFLVDRWDHVPSHVYPLILGFLEDWAKGISWQDPYPAGATSAGLLLERLLPHVKEGWRGESEKQRVLSLIVHAPKVVEPLFKDLIQRAEAITNRREDPEAELFAETLLKTFQTFAACRDFPDDVIQLCLSQWKARRTEDDNNYYSGLRDVDSVFGLHEHLPHRFFPASALQGPFHHLLLFHPVSALRFIVGLVNQAAEHYGEQRTRLQYVEEPIRVTMDFPDGGRREIWANARLWNAFRATSVMPHVLESALMALEKWALEAMAQQHTEGFALKALDWILRNTNNAALVSLVASICIAHPAKTGEIALALLGCRDFFALDRQRFVTESHSLAPGGMGYQEQLFQEERVASNKLPHRRRHLEQLALDLQLGPQRESVWKILDGYQSALPPLDQQNDEDRLWRLCLSRMDLRKYEQKGATEDGFIQIQMRPVESDIQAVIDRSAPDQDRYNRHISLFLWATNQFERADTHLDKAKEWRERLAQAKLISEELLVDSSDPPMASGGPAIVASICIRDRWDELGIADRAWCTKTVLDHVSRLPTGEDSIEFVAKNPMNGVPACAHVLPLMRRRAGPEADVVHGLITALLHFNEDVRLQAIRGVSEFLVKQDTSLTTFCVWVLVEHATKWVEIDRRERAQGYGERSKFMVRMKEAVDHVRRSASTMWYESFPDLHKLGFGSWPERQLARELIHLFREHPESEQARAYFARLSAALKIWWKLDRRRRSGGGEDRDYELEHLAERALAGFLLECPTQSALQLAQPLVAAASDNSEKVAGILRWLLILEDGRTSTTPFWELWQAFAEQVRVAPWVAQIDREHATGQQLVRETFLNTRWKEGIRNWSRLGPHFSDIDKHFEGMAASTFVLESYSHYLYHIGQSSLPNAFVAIADKFGDTLGASISSDGTLRWYQDALLARVMYEDLPTLKASPRLRKAVMTILDALVHAGSSVAFQLRDDFVTPSSNTFTAAS